MSAAVEVSPLVAEARDRQRRRRLAFAAALLGAVALALVANGRGSEPFGRGAATARFQDSRISFSYPAGWRLQFENAPMSMGVVVLAVLSNESLDALCGGDGTPGCGLSPVPLPRGGVYVSWMQTGPVAPGLADTFGIRTTIAGMPAKLKVDPHALGPNDCPVPSGTSGAVEVHFANRVVMTACANTSDFPRFEAQVLAMLRSTKLQVPAG